MQKIKTNTVLLVIIIILLVVGISYTVLINLRENREREGFQNDSLFENKNIEPIVQDNLSLVTHKSSETKYEIKYPSNWVVAVNLESKNSSNFQIKNSLNAVLPGANSEMRKIDSTIFIQVGSDGIDPLVHKTIDDVLKDPKFGVSKTDRVNNVVQMNIGGKNLRVEKLNNSTSAGYSFLYNGKVYNINFMAGSENQYNLDRKIFDDIMLSFILQ